MITQDKLIFSEHEIIEMLNLWLETHHCVKRYNKDTSKIKSMIPDCAPTKTQGTSFKLEICIE